MSADTVIYHNDCFDGYMSAFVLYLAGMISRTTVILPDVPSATDAPSNISGDVIIVDVAYQPSIIESIAKRARSVLFIDHHHTNTEAVEQLKHRYTNLTIIYDADQCGATLTWLHYFPTLPIPMAIRMVRDNDIGIWRMKNTKQFLTAFEVEFHMVPTRSALKKLKVLLTIDGLKSVIARGRLYYAYRDMMVERAARRVTVLNWGTYRVGFINIAGNIGGEVATRVVRRGGVDFVAAFHYNIRKRMFVYSLRSDSTHGITSIDVEKICRSYGGGGHRNACAYSTAHAPDAMVMDALVTDADAQTGGSTRDGDAVPISNAIFTSPLAPRDLVNSTMHTKRLK